MASLVLSEQEILQRSLFVPCTTKEQLHRWIMVYLGLDLPNYTIDPDSNSNPMDLVWEIYDAGMKRGKPPFNRIMAYASRDSFKTLGASILEVLAIVHMARSVAHMAAIEPQAQKAVSYVKDFLNRPYLRAYVTADNKRTVEIRRYTDPVSGLSITPKEWDKLETDTHRAAYKEIKNYLQVVICTPRGANSAHVPFFVVDEVDLAEPKAYEEAKLIPAPYQGKHAITLLTSTRKTSIGLVQKELDNQIDRKSGRVRLQVRHWNIIDVTEPCPITRHTPEKGKLPIYYSDASLQAMREKDFALLSKDEQKSFKVKDGYHGCLENCTLFAVCQGRLATDQKSTSLQERTGEVQGLLKPIDHVIQQFMDVSLPTAQAQLMCRKPSAEGLIYPNFERGTHMLRADQIAARITGEAYDESFTKADLIALMKTRDITFHSGMDFGFTHNFAVVTGALDGANLYIIDVIAIPGIEIGQKINLCDQKLKPYEPSIYADEAYPSDILTFKKAGFRIRGVKKEKGSVVGGIEIIRLKLMPAMGAKPQLFFLAHDEGVEILAQRVTHYHWKQDTAGNWTDIPEEKEDDECDALRYLGMSLFTPKGKFMNPAQTKAEEPPPPSQASQYTEHNWMKKQISELTGEPAQQETEDPAAKPAQGKRGSFFWSV
jgi:hypothetical protein